MQNLVKISFRRGASKIPAKGCPNGRGPRLEHPPDIQILCRDDKGHMLVASFGRDDRGEERALQRG